MAPDRDRTREVRAYTLWNDAMDLLGEVLIGKGIVEKPNDYAFHDYDKYYEPNDYICERLV
jgi:hypothetical protein